MQSILELEDVQLVDVRTPQEYEEERIANSQNIDYKKNMQKAQKTICWNEEEKKFNKMMKGIL